MQLNRRVLLGATIWLAACSGETASLANGGAADILLFKGTGSSPNDVDAIEAILREADLAYATIDTARLNATSQEDLRKHRLLIMPGGNFEDMGNALSPKASVNIREAVKDGLNYLGICAGAFIAGASPYNGFNLTGGKHFAFYALEAEGVRKARVWITTSDGARTEQYWEDGPQLAGWGQAFATYPDGTPSAVEGEAGKGWMVLLGTHPEAPESWRRNLAFTTPSRDAREFAKMAVARALNGPAGRTG